VRFYDVVTVWGEGGPLKRSGEVLEDGGTLSYHPATDELTIRAGDGAWLRLAPGGRFARELAHLMTVREQNAEELATLPSVQPCPVCRELIRVVAVGDGEIVLDARPNERGIYLLVNDDEARVLAPMEEPAGPVYRSHSCRRTG
jgi:hypothetical protein